jgi:hypothetical protein
VPAIPPIENNTSAGTPLAIQNAPRQSIALTSPPALSAPAAVFAITMIVSPLAAASHPQAANRMLILAQFLVNGPIRRVEAGIPE